MNSLRRSLPWLIFGGVMLAVGIRIGRGLVPERVVRVPANMNCMDSPTRGEVLCYVSDVRR